MSLRQTAQLGIILGEANKPKSLGSICLQIPFHLSKEKNQSFQSPIYIYIYIYIYLYDSVSIEVGLYRFISVGIIVEYTRVWTQRCSKVVQFFGSLFCINLNMQKINFILFGYNFLLSFFHWRLQTAKLTKYTHYYYDLNCLTIG